MSMSARIRGAVLLLVLAHQTMACLSPMPYGVENDWVRMEEAGMLRLPVEGSPDRFRVQFVFAFEAKRLDIASIDIEDVSGPEPVVLVRGKDVAAGDNRWVGPSVDMSPATLPWLYSPGDTRLLFRITFHTSYGETSAVLQPALFTDRTKRAYRELGVS